MSPPLDPMFAAAFDAAAVQAWRWDLATQQVQWTPGLERLLGLAPGSFGGTFDDYLAVIPPEDRAAVVEAIRRTLETGEPFDLEHRVLLPTGETRWVTCRGNVLRDAAGKPAGMAGMVWDVTARHEAEEQRRLAVEALRASEERLRFQFAILEQVNEAVVASDTAGRVIYWNPAAERLYGWTSAEALGAIGRDLLQVRWPHADDRTRMIAALDARGAWRGEMEHVTKAGERLTVEASVRLLRDPSGARMARLAVMQDVTTKRRLEEQLRQAQKMEAVGVLAGGVAHDFNNLLAVILGFAEISLRRLPAEHQDAQALSEIVAAAQRGADLTRKLLAFSRKQIIHRAPVDLNEAIGGIAKLLTRIVGEDIEVTVARSPAPLVVRADTVQIEQVVFNLCTNARHAMPKGGRLTIALREVHAGDVALARHAGPHDGRYAELAVSDTGCGMDGPTLERAFEPFFTTKESGTGLGLSTVYGIVQQHGGRIHAESVPGAGTTLRAFFPLEEEPGVPEPAPPPELVVPRGRETILIAEDSPPLRALVTSTLMELGYRVLTAEDGEGAVAEFERHADEVALVVLDVIMPKLGALEAYERMRALRPGVKALFTTGYAPEAARLAELLDGTRVRVLEKPFSSRTLGLSVRRAIDAA